MSKIKITKSKEWYYRASIVLFIAGWINCIIPTLAAGLIKLPDIVVKENEQTLSGMFTIVLIVSIYPLFKGVVRMLKSPSAWLLCWIFFAFTALLASIPHETLITMRDILLIAAIGNSVGGVCFFVSKKYKEKWRILHGVVGEAE